MRCSHAVDLGLHGPELVGELGGALLLGPERPQLASHVVQLGPGAPQLPLHPIHGVTRMERFELRGVQLLLKLSRTLRLSLQSCQLLDRHRELRLCALELGSKAHGLCFDLLDLFLARAHDRVASGQQLTGDPITLGGHAVEPLLERPRSLLGLDRTFLELSSQPDRLVAQRPLRGLQLLEGGAVLVLQEVEALLRLLRTGLGAPASLRLLLHPRPRCLDPSRRRDGLTRGDHRHTHPRGLRGFDRGPASEHRCAGGQQDEGERASEEEHVGAPWRCRAGDVIGGTRELDGGGAADTGRESQPDEHGKGVVDQPRLRLSPERVSDAGSFAGETLADVAVLGREEDLARRREQGHGVEVAWVEHDVVDRIGQLADPLGRGIVLEIVGSEDEREGAVRDDLGLLDRPFFRGRPSSHAHPERTRHPDDEQSDERDMDPSSQTVPSQHAPTSPLSGLPGSLSARFASRFSAERGIPVGHSMGRKA